MAENFLLYRPDPFGVGGSRYALATLDRVNFIDASEVGDLVGDVILTRFASS